VGLSCVELTPFTALHDVLGVSNCGWTVKTLSEGFPDKSSQIGMMFARPGMDLLKQLLRACVVRGPVVGHFLV
jgi:hypothetical protein